MASRGEVYMAMYGDDFDPDEVSAHIGLPATGGRRKGESLGFELPVVDFVHAVGAKFDTDTYQN